MFQIQIYWKLVVGQALSHVLQIPNLKLLYVRVFDKVEKSIGEESGEENSLQHGVTL